MTCLVAKEEHTAKALVDKSVLYTGVYSSCTLMYINHTCHTRALFTDILVTTETRNT